MPILDTFSKRQKRRERAGQPDVYQYDSLPVTFRIQVIYIWRTAIGPFGTEDWGGHVPVSNQWWREIHDTLARELGVFRLSDKSANPFAQCCQYLKEADK